MNLLTAREVFQTLLHLAASVPIKELLLSALGTFLGAYAAFVFAERRELRKALQAEALAVNRAFAAVYFYVNSSIVYRSTILVPKRDELHSIANLVKTHLSKTSNTFSATAPLQVDFDNTFVTLPKFHFPAIDVVTPTLALKYISGRPHLFVQELHRAVNDLETSVDIHNLLLKEIDALKLNNDDKAQIFAVTGICCDNGRRDHRYRDTVEKISDNLDAIEYFGTSLLVEFENYQRYLRTMQPKQDLVVMTISNDRKVSREKLAEVDLFKRWEQIQTNYLRRE